MDINSILTAHNLASWFLYVSTFGTAGILAHMSVVKRKKIYAVFAIALPALIGGLRYKVGVDYESYVEKLQLLTDRDLSSYLSTSLKNVFEPTFYVFSKLSLASPDQAIIFFTVTSGLTALFYYLAARKYSIKHAGLMFFLLMMTIFPKDLNGVRQGVAVAIGFYAISFIVQKKIWHFVSLVATASVFHYSAVLLLAAYPLHWLLFVHWPHIKDRYYILRILSFNAAGLGSAILALKNIASIPFFGRYAYLLSPEKLAAASTPNILSKLVPVLLVLPFYPSLVKQNRENAYYMLLSILSIAFTSLGLFAGFIHRLANYFIPFYAILFINTIETLGSEKKQRIAIILIVLYALAHFTGSNLIRNSYDIFPYQFIFMQ